MQPIEANDNLFEYRNKNGIGVFTFLDRIEMYHASQIRASVLERVEVDKLRGLVFSFEDVPYIDSTGVGVFLNLQYRLSDSVPIRLCNLSGNVRDVLTTTNLLSTFAIDDALDESLRLISQ